MRAYTYQIGLVIQGHTPPAGWHIWEKGIEAVLDPTDPQQNTCTADVVRAVPGVPTVGLARYWDDCDSALTLHAPLGLRADDAEALRTLPLPQYEFGSVPIASAVAEYREKWAQYIARCGGRIDWLIHVGLVPPSISTSVDGHDLRYVVRLNVLPIRPVDGLPEWLGVRLPCPDCESARLASTMEPPCMICHRCHCHWRRVQENGWWVLRRQVCERGKWRGVRDDEYAPIADSSHGKVKT